MRLIDADNLKQRAQKVATEAWKMNLTARVETILNQFIDWIDEADTVEQEQRWIPCSERLPEENEGVLTQAQFKDDGKMAVSSRVDFNYWTGWGTREINIVAWMPMPEPYKENQDV